ncbi:MAG: DUF5666 domain-containing protein [Piscinibacter sp.]
MNARSWLQQAMVCAAAVALVLGGCGGGVGSGGTGMASGVTQGTVNGFGSVFVDGDRFDDSGVAVFTEVAPGVVAQTSARLGARVEVESELGKARGLRLDAAVVGPVEALRPDGFEVLGQAIRINADASRGPVTQFGRGYTGLASVRVGDAVAVHAFALRSASGWSLQATRVEPLGAAPEFLKLSGLAAEVGPGGFRIGALRVLTGGATLLPAGAELAEGQAVSVLAPASSQVEVPGSGPQVHAAQVRMRRLGAAGDEVASSGLVGMLDQPPGTFDLGGLRVDYTQASVRPAVSALMAGRYVQVRGTLRADGTLRAESVRVLDGRSDAEAELKGTVLGFDADTLHFQVRGVDVDGSSAKFEGCPGGKPADGVFVEVAGRLGPTGVIAESVHCEDEPDDAVVERKGTAGDVDVEARQFTLTLSSGATLPVSWSDVTYFENVSAATLAGQRVEVEGKLVDGVMQARKIEVETDDD